MHPEVFSALFHGKPQEAASIRHPFGRFFCLWCAGKDEISQKSLLEFREIC